MKFAKDKTAIAFALFLMFAMAVTLVALPAANAHTPPWTVKTYAFIEAHPNPVGVGQTAYVTFWIDKVPPTAEGAWGCRWHNMKLTVTKPDGTTSDLGTFDSDPTGGAWTQYVPDQTGEYTFTFNFPTQVAYDDNPYPYYSAPLQRGTPFINDTFTESSATTTLTVQEEQIASAYPPNPLPTEFWSRPINSMNREWYSLGGNWLGLAATMFSTTGMYDASNGNFNPYTTAPNSAHVIWTKPVAFGGQIGGEFGSGETSLYATGTAYESKFGAVILYGVLYYTQYPGAMTNLGPLTAVDLRTGQTLWTVNASNPLKCGMVYNFITGDQYGGHAYLFTGPAMFGLGFVVGSTPNVWSMYDAMTGQWILDIANASAGTLVAGENGELLSYTAGRGMLSLWNVSKCIEAAAQKFLTYSYYSSEEIWRPPQGATIDWNGGYEWSVPVATNISGNPISLGVSKVSDDVVLLTQGATYIPGGHARGWRVDAGYSATDGHLLWGPVNRTLLEDGGVGLGAAAEGVYTEYERQTMTMTAYDIKTGKKLWGPSEPFNSSWNFYNYNIGAIAYGNLYVWGMSGEVHCYDVQTGEPKWSWYAGSAGVDTPYGTWPLATWPTHYVIADDKLYVRAGHDYTPPVFKGAKIYCLNATTGELIWSSLSFDVVSSPACADGHMVWFNAYDDQIYCYSKGPSATTVDAPMTSFTLGKSVVVRGTVTDKSPGTEEYAQTARFPNGVPAIADDDMSAWMEYLYQQQPKPANAKGVKVTISVLDPNNNTYDVATATSDENGFYSATFTPPVPGKYTVIATFAGSESYYGSVAETAISVEEAPTATAPPTPQPASIADLYLVPGIVGIIIAIAVVGAVIVLMLRKR